MMGDQLDLFAPTATPASPATVVAPQRVSLHIVAKPYPSSGITGPGQWGSADGVTWTRVPDGELLKVGGTSPFIMGYLIASADEAFRAMRDGIESTR